MQGLILLRHRGGERVFFPLALLLFILGWALAAQAGEPNSPDVASPAADSRKGAELNNRGVQEAQAGRLEQGIFWLRQALEVSPNDPQCRKNLSGMLTDWAMQLDQRGEIQRSIGALEEALTYNPDNGKALVLLGNLSYTTLGNLERAVTLWKKAFGSVSTVQWNGIFQRISQAQRDLVIERGFTARRIGHFQIRLEGLREERSVSLLTRVLEKEYARLLETLDVSVESLPVIVYADPNFKRIIGRKDWALGLYDGRIRLRLEDIETKWLPSVVAHELSHAFLAKAYGSHIPTWVHEGFAQYEEPFRSRTPKEEEVVKAVAEGRGWVPLKWLDRHFEQPSGREDLERVYAQSARVVEFLIRKEGISRFRDFLKRLSAGAPIDLAFDQAFSSLRWSKIDQGILE